MPVNPYPEISRLLEAEDFEKVNQDFARLYESLEKLNKNKGLGKSSGALKGMRAIEKTMDLLRELLKKKQEMAGK